MEKWSRLRGIFYPRENLKRRSEGGNDEEVNPPVQERKKTLKEKLGIKFPTLTRSKSHNKEEESKKSKEPGIEI